MNYYEVLNLNANATDKDIKKSYKKLVKIYHPDLYKGDKNFAEQKIKEINQAYEVLSNPESKKKYDDSLNIIYNDLKESYPNSNHTQSNTNNNTYSSTKYEDLYQYDYYKRFSRNYYGVDKSNEKDSQKNINKTQQDNSITISLKSIIIFLIMVCIVLIVLIILLQQLHSNINNYESNLNTTENVIDNEYNVYIGQTYDEVVQIHGQPDKVITYNYLVYVYYSDSYIIFSQFGYVVGWDNSGNFNTFKDKYIEF